jgi:hypothetical protein
MERTGVIVLMGVNNFSHDRSHSPEWGWADLEALRAAAHACRVPIFMAELVRSTVCERQPRKEFIPPLRPETRRHRRTSMTVRHLVLTLQVRPQSWWRRAWTGGLSRAFFPRGRGEGEGTSLTRLHPHPNPLPR